MRGSIETFNIEYNDLWMATSRSPDAVTTVFENNNTIDYLRDCFLFVNFTTYNLSTNDFIKRRVRIENCRYARTIDVD